MSLGTPAPSYVALVHATVRRRGQLQHMAHLTPYLFWLKAYARPCIKLAFVDEQHSTSNCVFRNLAPSMVSYPIDYDSSGEIQSVEFHDHDENASKLPHQDLHFPIPSGLPLTWKNGRRDRVVNLKISGSGEGTHRA